MDTVKLWSKPNYDNNNILLKKWHLIHFIIFFLNSRKIPHGLDITIAIIKSKFFSNNAIITKVFTNTFTRLLKNSYILFAIQMNSVNTFCASLSHWGAVIENPRVSLAFNSCLLMTPIRKLLLLHWTFLYNE